MNSRILWLLCSLLCAQLVHAHGLHVFVLSHGDKLLGRAYFSDGAPAVAEQVSVYAPPEKLLGITTTDDNGRFTFPITAKTDYTIVVEGMEGHKTEYRLAASELAISPTGQNPIPTTELQPLIANIVRQELQPLREQLDRYENKTRWHDVLGGIGYIVGLMGLLFYFKK